MGIVEQQREEERLYREHLREILEAIQRDEDLVGVARKIAEAASVDERTTYRWVQFTERDLDRSRKRLAIRGLVPLWIGIIVLVVLAVGLALGDLVVTSPEAIIAAAAGIASLAAGVLLLRRLTTRAVQHILRAE